MVCFCLCSLFYRDDVLCWLLLARPFLYAFHAHLRFPVDLVWFRLSCDHGWIRSGSVNVRKQQQQQWWHARDRGHCRGKPGSALSGEYAPDSARAEGSSIVDEPGECSTPVRENQRREPGGFLFLREKLISDLESVFIP